MRTGIVAAAILLSVGHAGTALADCSLKDPPPLPDGASASEPEMMAAQQAIKSYLQETQEFLACLEGQSRGRLSNEGIRRYNEAIERMEKLAASFNRELRTFKSR